MGLFEHFPYTNFHDLNLDKILERTKEAEEAAQSAAEDAAQAVSDTSAAVSTASNAVSIANNAKNKADDAYTAAGNAQSTADQAILDAAAASAAAAATITPTLVTQANLINSDNTYNCIVKNTFCYKLGNLLIGEIYFRATNTYCNIALKSPYNDLAIMRSPVYLGTEIDNVVRYNDFHQACLYVDTTNGFRLTQLISNSDYLLTFSLIINQ